MKTLGDKQLDNLIKSVHRTTYRSLLEVLEEKLTDYEIHIIVRAFDRLRNHWIENKDLDKISKVLKDEPSKLTNEEINTIIDDLLKKVLRQFMNENDVSVNISKHNLAGFTK